MKRRTRKSTRLDSCHGKKQMSKREADRMAEHRMNCGAVSVKAYHCRFCGFYHTGSRKIRGRR